MLGQRFVSENPILNKQSITYDWNHIKCFGFLRVIYKIDKLIKIDVFVGCIKNWGKRMKLLKKLRVDVLYNFWKKGISIGKIQGNIFST